MIRAAVFDIDDTLYDFTAAHAAAMAALDGEAARRLGLAPAAWREAVAEAFRWQYARDPATAGFHSRFVRFQRVLEARNLPLAHAAPLADFYWASLLAALRPAPGAAALLAALRARGVRLGVGTDMTADWQLRKLERLGLLDFFSFAVTSEEAGAEKPAPAFFALCVEKAGCATDDVAFVGDNLGKDALGARAAGLRGIWLAPAPDARAAHPEVEAVPDLPSILPLLAGGKTA